MRSKKPALEPIFAFARFGMDGAHSRRIERRLGFGNLIGDIVTGDHKGRFVRKVEDGWELNVPWFGGKVPIDIVCKAASGMCSAK